MTVWLGYYATEDIIFFLRTDLVTMVLNKFGKETQIKSAGFDTVHEAFLLLYTICMSCQLNSKFFSKKITIAGVRHGFEPLIKNSPPSKQLHMGVVHYSFHSVKKAHGEMVKV